MLKTTRITVETDTLMVLRRARAVLAWCPDCRTEVNVINLTRESLADAATMAQLQHWLDTGKLHLWQPANGPIQICVPSLLQRSELQEFEHSSPVSLGPLDQLRRRLKMKAHRWISNLFRLTCIGLALTFFVGSVRAQQHPATQDNASYPPQYAVIDLGTLGGTFSIAYGINDRGQIDGFSTIPGDTATHAFVLNHGVFTDLGTLGGTNSLAYEGPNQSLQTTGLAETSTLDPNGEDFCGFGTHLICLAFSWQNGIMTPLDTLGGNNAQGGALNDSGQIAGYAENTTIDPNCPPPQVLQFRPVVWTNGRIQALPVYSGDPEGGAFWINNRGEAVGASGTCAPFDPRYGVALAPKHAVLWRNRTVPINLGNLGGSFNNAGFAINDIEQVVGASDLAGDQYQHAFIWQNGVISDMGTLSGDVMSAALAINNRGQATGVSIDANGDLRAFLWQNGVMTDLNSLIPPNSPLYLLHGYGINSFGEVVGFALVQSTGEIHGFLAIPVQGTGDPGGGGLGVQNGSQPVTRHALPENVRKLLRQSLHGRVWVPRDAAMSAE